jgi:nucleoside-diphosphate-sugar epimerase
MTSTLVTGGAGFIGSHLVEELLAKGHRVRVLDNFSSGRQERLEPFAGGIEIVGGDLRSRRTVREAVDGVDFVLHQAAVPSVPQSVEDPVTTNDVNVGGTLNLLEAARDAGVKRLVNASSCSVYGDTETVPNTEDMVPKPISPYAVSKLTGEFYCRVFSQLYGLETVSLRYFNAFGPGMDPGSAYAAVIAIFTVGLIEGRPLTINGDGTFARDFTYVKNVVHANTRALEAEGVSGEVFNVGCGATTSLNEVVEILRELLQTEGDIRHGPERPGDIRRSLAGIDKARRMLGYVPRVPAREGIERTVTWYRNEGRSAGDWIWRTAP